MNDYATYLKHLITSFSGKRAPTDDHQTCWSEACPR